MEEKGILGVVLVVEVAEVVAEGAGGGREGG